MSQWTGTALPISAQDVRDYLKVEGTTGSYSTNLLNSNIRAAASRIQRETGRQFEQQDNTTKVFTSNDAAFLAVPDFRSLSSVTRQGSALTQDQSWYAIPDARHNGIYTGIQFRAFQVRPDGPSYLHNPEWFDRNLDHPRYTGTSLPNDISAVGDWGWDDNAYPPEFLMAVKVLAAWYTKRPASVLANVAVTNEGTALVYSDFPPEVVEFIKGWQTGAQVAVITGG